MAFNKTKLIEAAQKYLQQGKLHQAIGEYQQILKQEPRDQVILMTVGDLLVRQGETFQALEYFERLAQVFINDGFTTKAIAIYKKIAKLAPEETRPLERLAELYVQQGVLSEARPLYLQMAEAHLKAGRQQQGVALLKRLLEAEPDNLRVQLRMAELSVAMGQPDAAVEAYRSAAQRLLEHGDHAEALRLLGRALEIEPKNSAALLLKARTLIASDKRAEALTLLESLPGIEDGGPEAELLIAEYLARGTFDPAIALSEKIFARNPERHRTAHTVADALLEAGALEPALKLIGHIRGAMTENDHEGLEHTLDRASEKMPERYEPLEWLIELFGRNNDSFRLPDVLARLAQTAEKAGDFERARVAYEQLLDRNPEDEATRRRYVQLRARLGLEPMAELTPFVKMTPAETAPPPPPTSPDPPLDDETQRFVLQALTDVDLFSSYGLTQKAIELLEEVRGRAPTHAPILERLLDLNLGAGDERRTADLAAQLEQLWLSRGDRARAERYTELRCRFDRAAGATAETAAPARSEHTAPIESEPPATPPEFSVSVPVVEAEVVASEPLHPEFEMRPASEEPAETDQDLDEDAVHEVDLSEEWAALSQQIEATMEAAPAEASPLAKSAEKHERKLPAVAAEDTISAPAGPRPTSAPDDASHEEPTPAAIEYDFEIDAPAGAEEELSSERLLSELANGFDDIAALLVGEPESAPAPAAHPVAGAPEHSHVPEPSIAAAPAVVAHIPKAPTAVRSASVAQVPVAQVPSAQVPAPPVPAAPVSPSDAPSKATVTTQPNAPVANTDHLHQVFEEFRAELGEIDTQEEDIETHYNLGVAYREMGLLEEAISEFQKVAKASDRDQAFRYALQCCTLLGLSFMEKGQPAIAAVWYQRALRIPELDRETQLALHYDLGVSLDLAGDTAGAQRSFAEVYATNIDYRDVAERLAALDKAR
ncbi:MAG: tetratricopeptide repeat protein [Candidatus Acidiferrales bacterium]